MNLQISKHTRFNTVSEWQRVCVISTDLPTLSTTVQLLSSSLALQGVLQDDICNGVVLSDVAKPGELALFHCYQQGFLLSSERVYLLSDIFICLVFGI